MLYYVTLKSPGLLLYVGILSGFLCFSCVADVILKGEKTSSECEQQALQKMSPSTCKNICDPQMFAASLQIIDCRLYLLGKPPLRCSYIPRTDSFTCKHPVDEMMINEILVTLLNVFETCHSTFANHFATETSLLLQKLSSSTKTAEEMNVRLIRSQRPLELIQQVQRIQKDAYLVETVVLKKAYAVNKKIAEVRRSISNRPLHLRSNFTKKIGENLWDFENCFSNPTGSGESGHSHSECMINAGLCLNHGQVEWIFSIICTALFLDMMDKISHDREQAFSALVFVALLLFSVRAYGQSQNYTTFLEQFFLETVAGFSLLAIFSMKRANARLYERRT